MADSQIGRTLGSYRLVELIGKGGMGVVYRGIHLKLGREAAVKILPESLATDQNFLRRFEREAANAATLNHSNILAVWEYGEEQGVPYLVMPYLTGGTLRQQLADGPLAPRVALDYLRQVADALDYAHEQGIIHRDVKPANLLLDDRKQVYLADFGIAKALEGAEGLTRTGVGVGTPEYMAPEQAQGRADSRSDLYALGIILYQLLTGRVPYSGNSTVEVLMKHLQDPLPMLPLRSVQPPLPPRIEQIIQKALAKNPNDRYQTGRALVEAFSEAIGGGAGRANAPTVTSTPPLPGGGSPATYGQTLPYGSAPPPAGGVGGGYQAPTWQAPAPVPSQPPTPTPFPTIPTQPTPAPYPSQQPYQTPLPPQPFAGRQVPLEAYAPPAPAKGSGGRIAIGALAGVAIAILLCLTGLGAYALFRPGPTPTPQPTVNAAATGTASAVAAAGQRATQTAAAPTLVAAATATATPPALPTPTAAVLPTAPPTAPATRQPPTATRAPTAVAALPLGQAPAGWKTYAGQPRVPFAIYYPPDWTIDEQSSKDGIIYIRPPSGNNTWLLVATTGVAEPNGNIDVLRDQYYSNTLGECKQKAIDRTNYTEYSGITFAGLGATCETGSGLNYARIGLGLKGQVPWRYRLNAPYGEYSDALDKYFQPMLNSLNIYRNP